MKLSVVISAYNEAKKIKDCLRSVSFADEIILIDNSSTDGTGTIATSFGAKVYKKPNNLMLNVNKNFGFSKASHEWILSLDADERITLELQKEIESIIRDDSSEGISGYAIPRKNIIFGKWIEHTGWYPDFQLRLFRRGKGKFPEKHVHEQLSLSGEMGKLKEPMIHESYQTISEFLMKFFTIYAPNEAENMLRTEGFTFSYRDALSRPAREFINRFYTNKGYKDGVHGLMLSLLMAFYYFVVVTYIWEKKKFVSNQQNILEGVENELKDISKNRYWQLTAKIDESQHPLQKMLLRFKRKLLFR